MPRDLSAEEAWRRCKQVFRNLHPDKCPEQWKDVATEAIKQVTALYQPSQRDWRALPLPEDRRPPAPRKLFRSRRRVTRDGVEGNGVGVDEDPDKAREMADANAESDWEMAMDLKKAAEKAAEEAAEEARARERAAANEARARAQLARDMEPIDLTVSSEVEENDNESVNGRRRRGTPEKKRPRESYAGEVDESGFKINDEFCGVCDRNYVTPANPLIQCDSCEAWVHYKCANLNKMPENETEYFCCNCRMKMSNKRRRDG